MNTKPLLILSLAAVLLFGGFSAPFSNSPQPAEAQGSIVDVVLRLVSENLGIQPVITQGALDAGTYSFNADLDYEFQGIETATEGLTCTAPLVGSDTSQFTGTTGYMVRVTIQEETYEYRSNNAASRMIRCEDGVQVEDTFGAFPTVNPTITGDEAARLVINDLNTYLDLRMTIDLVNNNALDYPVRYDWLATIFDNPTLDCGPAPTEEEVAAGVPQGQIFGYDVDVRINGVTYDYRVGPDGLSAVLCLRGGTPLPRTLDDPDFTGTVEAGGTAAVATDGEIETTADAIVPSDPSGITGWDVMDILINDLNAYFGLNMTRAAIDDFALPYEAGYEWVPVTYQNTALNCPAANETFQTTPVTGYDITFFIDGSQFFFVTSSDGSQIRLCNTGVPDQNFAQFRANRAATSQ